MHKLYDREMNFSFVRLNFECDKMLLVMKDHYNEIEFCDKCQAQKRSKTPDKKDQ